MFENFRFQLSSIVFYSVVILLPWNLTNELKEKHFLRSKLLPNITHVIYLYF